jgi:hypothetical protein
MKLLLIGHSHADCVDAALRASRIEHRTVFLHRMPRDNVPYMQKARDRVVAAARELYDDRDASTSLSEMLAHSSTLPVLSIGGNNHNIIGLIKGPEPFDFILKNKEDLDVDNGANVLPYSLMREFLYTNLRETFLQILDFRNMLKIHTVHISSPPPIADDTFIENNLDDFFKKKQGGDHSVVHKALRYKLWRLSADLYKEFCIASDVRYLMPPEPVMDHGMFLAPQFYGKDATHANSLYGAAIVDQLQEYSKNFELV